MRPPKLLPSVEELNRLFIYDPDSGELRWRHITHHNMLPGGVIRGKTKGGYLTVSIAGKTFYVHRIIWKMTRGTEPPPLIDHHDTTPQNNRPDNLREATETENHANSRVPSHNTSGTKGVCFIKSRGVWVARYKVKGKQIHVFQSRDLEKVKTAMIAAREKVFGAFANHG